MTMRERVIYALEVISHLINLGNLLAKQTIYSTGFCVCLIGEIIHHFKFYRMKNEVNFIVNGLPVNAIYNPDENSMKVMSNHPDSNPDANDSITVSKMGLDGGDGGYIPHIANHNFADDGDFTCEFTAYIGDRISFGINIEGEGNRFEFRGVDILQDEGLRLNS